MQPADVLYDQLQPFSDGREEGRFSKLHQILDRANSHGIPLRADAFTTEIITARKPLLETAVRPCRRLHIKHRLRFIKVQAAHQLPCDPIHTLTVESLYDATAERLSAWRAANS